MRVVLIKSYRIRSKTRPGRTSWKVQMGNGDTLKVRLENLFLPGPEVQTTEPDAKVTTPKPVVSDEKGTAEPERDCRKNRETASDLSCSTKSDDKATQSKTEERTHLSQEVALEMQKSGAKAEIKGVTKNENTQFNGERVVLIKSYPRRVGRTRCKVQMDNGKWVRRIGSKTRRVDRTWKVQMDNGNTTKVLLGNLFLPGPEEQTTEPDGKVTPKTQPEKDCRTMSCAACGEAKPSSEFSKSQLKKPSGARCKDCVGTTKPCPTCHGTGCSNCKDIGFMPKRRRLAPSTLVPARQLFSQQIGESAATILERRRCLIGDSRDPPVLRHLLDEIQGLNGTDI